MITDLYKFINNHFHRSNNGAMQLIIIHAIIFIGLLLAKSVLLLLGYENSYNIMYNYLILPASWDLFLQKPWSLVTYFWVQEQFFTVIWNSLFLYAFGQVINSFWNSKILKSLYVFGGMLAGIFFLLLYNAAPGLQAYKINLIGPSGSLYAVMTAAAVILPNTYFRLFLIGNIKIKHIMIFLLLLACFELTNRQGIGIAQLGGALTGYLFAKYVHFYGKIVSFLKRIFSRNRNKTKFKVNYSKSNTRYMQTSVAKHQNKSDINIILDKISASGYKSLTQQEKEQLFHAGK